VELTPDQIFDELRTLRDQLESLQPDAAERARLEERRAALRDQARMTSDAARNPGNLRTELEHLLGRLAELDDERVEVPNWQKTLTANGRFSITNPIADAERINAKLDKATEPDRAAIVARIAQIEEVLDD
jgi:hypothetical protein